ncbi:hypothetical protein FB446DRAFT_790108 [Lentinula raphanica]|nr:hypothetical protein FB446DRAFT_790108 [Lentinula raphanica]
MVACIVTSTVTLSSPECEELILDNKFAIGQTFRPVSDFVLKKVEVEEVEDDEEELRRTYTLTSPGIECEILEVFPSRDMFKMDGEEWLKKQLPIRRWTPESDTKYVVNVGIEQVVHHSVLLSFRVRVMIKLCGERAPVSA